LKYIPIRICSRIKTKVKVGYLNELYSCDSLKALFKTFSEYAILSRNYGICFSDKKYVNYDDSEEKDDEELMKLLKEQVKNPIYEDITFVYYNHRPLTHKKWVKMLKDAGFKTLEKPTIDDLKNFLIKKKSSKASIDQWMKRDD
jgi:hypothetical protein